jgi:hypothetical protein
MANTQAGLGAQRYAKFLNSEAGQPMRNYYNTLTEHYKSKGKPSSATPVVTHSFVGGNAHSYTDALSALKQGRKLDLSGATKEQQAMLNTKYLQSLNKKPTDAGRSAYDVVKDSVSAQYSISPNTMVSFSNLTGNNGGSRYSSIPVMR